MLWYAIPVLQGRSKSACLDGRVDPGYGSVDQLYSRALAHGSPNVDEEGDMIQKNHYLIIIQLIFALQLSVFPVGTRLASIGERIESTHIYLPVVSVNYVAPTVKVVETVLLRSRFGNYRLTANLQNQGTDAVYEVGVRTRFFDEQGQWIETYTNTTVLPANFAGQFNLIEVNTNIDAFYYPNAQVDTQVISWTLSSTIPYWPLTLIYSQIEENGSNANVLAVFRNDSPQSLIELHP